MIGMHHECRVTAILSPLRLPADVGQTLNVAMSGLGGEQPLQQTSENQLSSDSERQAVIDFPAQFQLHLQNGVDAQVAGLVNKQSSLVANLRTISPPDCDQRVPLSADALRRAQIDQARERKHNAQARAVHAREVKRKQELGIMTVAEAHMRSNGHNPTDLVRRRDLLELQAGGQDTNGNWVNSSKDGGPSLLQRKRLWQETDERTVCAEVSKAATAQVEQVVRVQTRKEARHLETQVDIRAHLCTSPSSPPASPPHTEAESPMDTIEPSGPISMEVDTPNLTPLTAETPATLPATVGPPWPTLKVTHAGHAYRIPVLLSRTTVAELFGKLLPRITRMKTLPCLPKVCPRVPAPCMLLPSLPVRTRCRPDPHCRSRCRLQRPSPFPQPARVISQAPPPQPRSAVAIQLVPSR